MRSTTQWTMVNLEDKSFIKINTLDNIPSFEKRDDDLSFPKVNPQEKYDSHKTFEVRYDDIDINGHVNNANYVVWAFEALSHDFRKSHKLKTLDIIYKKDITYGNRVVSSLITENNKTYHILTNEQTNEQLCILDAEWVEL